MVSGCFLLLEIRTSKRLFVFGRVAYIMMNIRKQNGSKHFIHRPSSTFFSRFLNYFLKNREGNKLIKGLVEIKRKPREFFMVRLLIKKGEGMKKKESLVYFYNFLRLFSL